MSIYCKAIQAVDLGALEIFWRLSGSLGDQSSYQNTFTSYLYLFLLAVKKSYFFGVYCNRSCWTNELHIQLFSVFIRSWNFLNIRSTWIFSLLNSSFFPFFFLDKESLWYFLSSSVSLRHDNTEIVKIILLNVDWSQLLEVWFSRGKILQLCIFYSELHPILFNKKHASPGHVCLPFRLTHKNDTC